MQAKVNPADGLSYVEFTYRRRIGSVGLTYTIQTSVNCNAWSANSANYQQVGLPVPVGDGVAEAVTVRILPAIGTPGVPARFARLRVSSP